MLRTTSTRCTQHVLPFGLLMTRKAASGYIRHEEGAALRPYRNSRKCARSQGRKQTSARLLPVGTVVVRGDGPLEGAGRTGSVTARAIR